jgi:fluoride exporter
VKIAAIAVGGALGALARYGVGLLVTVTERGFPWPTFGVNITGSFAAGVLAATLGARSEVLSAGLVIGFLGAYTTFSAFAVQTQSLLSKDASTMALVYVVLSVVAGIGAAWAGVLVGRKV